MFFCFFVCQVSLCIFCPACRLPLLLLTSRTRRGGSNPSTVEVRGPPSAPEGLCPPKREFTLSLRAHQLPVTSYQSTALYSKERGAGQDNRSLTTTLCPLLVKDPYQTVAWKLTHASFCLLFRPPPRTLSYRNAIARHGRRNRSLALSACANLRKADLRRYATRLVRLS